MATDRERQAAYAQRLRAAGKVPFKAWVNQTTLTAFRAKIKEQGKDAGTVLERLLLDYAEQKREPESPEKLKLEPTRLAGEATRSPAREDTRQHDLELAQLSSTEYKARGQVEAPAGAADVPASGRDAGQKQRDKPADQIKPAEPIPLPGKPKLRKVQNGYLVELNGKELGRVERCLVSERPKTWIWKSHPLRISATIRDHRTRAEAVARLVAGA